MVTDIATMDLQKILLVDDDKAFTYLNRYALTDVGLTCPIDDCLNGEEAIKYIGGTDKQPDIILLDLNMPVMDGFDFLDALAETKASIAMPQVFILSSGTNDAERDKGRQYPCVKGFFEKPMSEIDIENMLHAFQQNQLKRA